MSISHAEELGRVWREGARERQADVFLCLPNPWPCRGVQQAQRHIVVCIFQDLYQHLEEANLRSCASTK